MHHYGGKEDANPSRSCITLLICSHVTEWIVTAVVLNASFDAVMAAIIYGI
jgi:hypothetical protein